MGEDGMGQDLGLGPESRGDDIALLETRKGSADSSVVSPRPVAPSEQRTGRGRQAWLAWSSCLGQGPGLGSDTG